MKNRKIKVTEYALAEVIEALTNDTEHFVDIVVTKEDGYLVVMFNPTLEECERLNDSLSGKAKGLLDKAAPKEDKPISYYPMHADPILCDITASAGENNTNMTTRQSCETLY